MNDKFKNSEEILENNFGKLSIVATPIGNLGDFSVRAKNTLLSADIIVAEDTRTLRSLLPEENLKAELIRGDDISEEKASMRVLSALLDGKNVAFITDAGTPGISDPGYILVKKVREEMPEVIIEAIPGPSALTSAISISGIPATPFTFLGFPPAKKGRLGFFKKITELDHTAILYESPHRFLKTLSEISEAFADAEKNSAKEKSKKSSQNSKRKIFIGRELTKMHEEGKYGTLSEIIDYYESNPDKVRGEFVIIISAL